MPGTVVRLNRPLEPYQLELERLQKRIDWVRLHIGALIGERGELVRQFVENDLLVESGPRKGKPLTRMGRRRRLRRLVEVERRLDGLLEKERTLWHRGHVLYADPGRRPFRGDAE